MQELINKAVKWGQDRGLDKVGHEAQARYTLKETAELLDAYADKDIDAINDAIGDILVTLIVGASNNRETLDEFRELLTTNRSAHGLLDIDCSFHTKYPQLTHVCLDLIVRDEPDYYDYMPCVYVLNYVLSSINKEFNQTLSLKDCLELAYNEIKNRTGKLVNGQFIKDN